MKDLPKVFANKIGNLNNTQEFFYGNDRVDNQSTDSISVIRKINNIFASPNHVYKSHVKITLKKGIVEKTIVGKTSTDLITIEGEKIKIIDIVDIVKI